MTKWKAFICFDHLHFEEFFKSNSFQNFKSDIQFVDKTNEMKRLWGWNDYGTDLFSFLWMSLSVWCNAYHFTVQKIPLSMIINYAELHVQALILLNTKRDIASFVPFKTEETDRINCKYFRKVADISFEMNSNMMKCKCHKIFHRNCSSIDSLCPSLHISN